MNHTTGGIYFRVKYLDSLGHRPVVQSFVFLGKNLSEDDTEETWYFQDLVDFDKYGSALAPSVEPPPVVRLTANALADDMFGVDGLYKALKAATRTGISLGGG